MNESIMEYLFKFLSHKEDGATADAMMLAMIVTAM
jgi:hypothetical protein